MKRNFPIDVITPNLDKSLIGQVVFHEAGHAAAIHLYNRQKQLPPVYFEISIKNIDYPLHQFFVNSAATREHLAAYILDNMGDTISCEDAMTVLDRAWRDSMPVLKHPVNLLSG